jgi:anti-sigma regulatory factor (Ser/Thr protein kinase)
MALRAAPSAELVLDADFGAVPRSRRFVTSCLSGLVSAADAELMTAELVTNALLHGAAPIVLRLQAEAAQPRLTRCCRAAHTS